MNLLINPFKRIAGWKALIIGIFCLSLTALIGKINHLFFSGIFNVSPFPHTFYEAFYAQGINWVVLTLVMWIAGKIFSKSKIRIIDVAGTMALSRAPLLLLVLAGFLPFFPGDLSDYYKLLIFNLICILLFIWMVALMYKAYSVSCNMKGTRGVLTFVGALIIAQAISLIIFSTSNLTPFASDDHRSNDIETIIPEGQTINQTAYIVIEAFKKSEIKTVRAYFDETMKNELPEMKLRLTWMQLSLQLGKLKDANTNVNSQQRDNYSIITIPCTFERGKLNLQLVFNHKGKISGMFFR